MLLGQFKLILHLLKLLLIFIFDILALLVLSLLGSHKNEICTLQVIKPAGLLYHVKAVISCLRNDWTIDRSKVRGAIVFHNNALVCRV
jgi:hypothetical protein